MEILTKDQSDVKQFTRSLEGYVTVIETPADLWPEIENRLVDGSPFQTLRGARQKLENVVTINEVHYVMVLKDNILLLRAQTRTKLLGQISVAKRHGKGNYEVLTYAEEFERWIDGLGQPRNCGYDGTHGPLGLQGAVREYGLEERGL